jgi:hypothetical protein
MLKLLEDAWDTQPQSRFKLALEGAFYAITFSCGLRGEEVPLTDLNGTQKH